MRRIILIGASNVTVSFPLLVASLRRTFAPPIEIIAAHGHGRSFGQPTHVGPRGLSGLLDCGLWERIAERCDDDGCDDDGCDDDGCDDDAKPLALVTDIGNDLMYGVAVDELVGWVEECVDRLAEQGAAITLGRLPIASVSRLGTWRYRITKNVFFPGQGPPLDELMSRVRQTDERVAQLAQRSGAASFVPAGEWYGVDPIHIRRGRQRQAWAHILSCWPGVDEPTIVRPGIIQRTRLWRLRPQQRQWFGEPQLTEQPARTFDDGTSVWLY